MNGKHMQFVFGLPDNTATPLDVDDDMVIKYQEQITKEQQDLLGDDAALRDHQPVFYLMEEGKLVFFGHTMMFRLPFQDSIQSFIPEKLRDSNTIDIAEGIFGFVRDDKMQKKPQAVASRIFVSDGKCQHSEDIWLLGDADSVLTPKILASPKPTTFQHYLVQDEEAKSSKNSLKHYASQPVEETVIRGHKLYWHKGESPDIRLKQVVSPTQKTTIKPIKPGVRFSFSIHFENLTSVEMGALLWVLDIAQDERYRLSLGMGKPLGMGAIRIKHQAYLNSRKSRYECLFNQEDSWKTGYSELEDENTYIRSFEKYVLNDNSGEKSLSGERRIAMLLALLQWEGSPSIQHTRYMEIERNTRKYPDDYIGKAKGGKANEYAERPVLPTPLQVVGREDLSTRFSAYASAVNNAEASPNQKQQARQQEMLKLIADYNLKEGDIVEATVTHKGSKKMVTYQVGDLSVKQREPKKYGEIPEGAQVKILIKSIKDDNIKHVKFVELA